MVEPAEMELELALLHCLLILIIGTPETVEVEVLRVLQQARWVVFTNRIQSRLMQLAVQEAPVALQEHVEIGQINIIIH